MKLQPRAAGDLERITRLKTRVIDAERATSDMYVGLARGVNAHRRALRAIKEPRVELHVLVQRDCPLFACQGCHQSQLAALLAVVKVLLFIAGRNSVAGGADPDLKEV